MREYDRFVRWLEENQRINPGACWCWTRLNTWGYGMVDIPVDAAHLYPRKKTRSQLAHRIAYYKIVGPIPGGLTIDHLCRVTSCCNPAHMEPVTAQENKARAERLRTHCKRGHPLSGDNLRPSGLKKGLRTCVACMRMHGRAHYWKDPEKQRARNRGEARNAWSRQHYAENRERVLARQREYYAKNRERIRARQNAQMKRKRDATTH